MDVSENRMNFIGEGKETKPSALKQFFQEPLTSLFRLSGIDILLSSYPRVDIRPYQKHFRKDTDSKGYLEQKFSAAGFQALILK